MKNSELTTLFEQLSTAHVTDACLRLRYSARHAPPLIRPLNPSRGRAIGRVRPARHYGSVDIFLEALDTALPGDVLVIDNNGREDEACVGDLIALEAQNAGVAGIVIWGRHRDTRELLHLAIPVFSLGAFAAGPVRMDSRESDALVSARCGHWLVDAEDFVFADEDGVVFISISQAEEIAAAARVISETEIAQAARMHRGTTLRSQLQFSDFISRRASDPTLTFRDHLRKIGGAVEE
jgi:4-hydroxy-4-methyl-2-oxoglutarate aldolase